MIILLPTDTLRIVCAAAPASELPIWASYADEGATPDIGRASAITTGTTPVVAVTAPAADHQRVVRTISIHNPNATGVTVTVTAFDGTHNRILRRAEIAGNGTLEYDGQWSQILEFGSMAGEDVADYYTIAQSDLAYDALGAASTVQGNLDTHIGLEGTDVHGLGTIATQAANNVDLSGGTISGMTSIAATGKISTSSTDADSIATAGGIRSTGGTTPASATAAQVNTGGGQVDVGTKLTVRGTAADAIQSLGGVSAAGTVTAGDVALTGVLQTDDLTGTQDNYDIGSASVLTKRSGSNITFTGWLPKEGRIVYYINGAANSTTFNHADDESSAANQFLLPGFANMTLASGAGALFIYLFSRWRCITRTL